MTLHLIGLGLNEKSITIEAHEAIQTCKHIYLEGYTVDYPYTKKELEQLLNKKIEVLGREVVESEVFLEEAKEEDIALLVYGDPLSATTHITLKKSCEERGIAYKVYHNASILAAIGETGLSLYKFGKTTSIPNWKEHTNKPTSYMKYIQENQTINAHSLILCDIGMTFRDAIQQLQEAAKKEKIEINNTLITSNLGTDKQQLLYGTIEELQEKKIEAPYSIIIPGEMSHNEKENIEQITS